MFAVVEEHPLREEHPPIDRRQKDRPAPHAGLEQVFAQQTAAHQGHEEIHQVEEAHRLHGSNPDERRDCQQDHRQGQLEDPVGEDGQRKARQ